MVVVVVIVRRMLLLMIYDDKNDSSRCTNKMAQWLKVISTQAWPPELIPRTHVNVVKVERENQLLKLSYGLPTGCDMFMPTLSLSLSFLPPPILINKIC